MLRLVRASKSRPPGTWSAATVALLPTLTTLGNLPLHGIRLLQKKEKAMGHVFAYMTRPGNWKSWKSRPTQGVIKRDWVPTGRIDFATRLDGNQVDADQPSEFRLLVEERRIVESITGIENLEIQWRLATLNEAKAVIAQYHSYLSENSLIKPVDETVSWPSPKKIEKLQEKSTA
jgi:hypothetical protein